MPTVGPYLWVALTSLPGDNPYLYTDLTPWVRDDAGVGYATRRGRQQVTQKFNTGRATYVLDNRDRRFESLNTTGPYYGNLVPMRAVQSGIEYPWLPGIIPNSDLRTSATTSGWSNVAGSGFIGYAAPASKMDYGTLTMTNTNGVSGHQDVKGPTFPIAAAGVGGPISFSVRAKNTGTGTASGCQVELLCYSDAGGTVLVGTILGTTQNIQVNQLVSLRGTGTIPASTVCARMLVTIGTPVTANALTFNCLVADYTSLSIHSEVYTGYSDSWNCEWDVGDNVCTLSCSDAFKALGLAPLTTPFYGTYLASLSPAKWYRVDETVVNQSDTLGLLFKDQVTGLKDASVFTGSWDNGQSVGYRGAGPLAGVAGASPVDNDLAFSMVGPSSTDSGAIQLPPSFFPTGTGWTVAFWYRSTNGTYGVNINPSLGIVPAQDQLILQMGATSWNQGPQVVTGDILLNVVVGAKNGNIGATFNDSGLNHGVYTPTDGSGYALASNQDIVSDLLWHRVVITYVKATNQGLIYIDGLLKQTMTFAFNGNAGTGIQAAARTTIHNFAGWPWYFGKDKAKSGGTEFWELDELMMWNTTLSAGTIATDYQKARQAYPIQTSLARAGSVLDTIGWPSGLRNIITTNGVQVPALTKAFYQANPLQYLQQIEDSESGMLFTDTQGRITFIDVNTMETSTSVYSTPQATFGVGVGEIPYEKIVTRNEDSTLYTRATATKEGGAIQTVDATAAQAKYGLRSIDKNGLVLPSDEKAYNIALYNATLFSVPGTKLQSITFNPYADEATLNIFLSLELGMAIKVRVRPPGITPGTYYEVLCSIQSINTDISRNKGRCTIDVSDIYVQRWMQFGDNYNTYNMGI